MGLSGMHIAMLLIALFTYGILWAMKNITFGEPPLLLKHKGIVAIAVTIAFVLIIETFK